MIEFQELRYKNLLSSGNNFITIRFDEAPTTLVLGNNGDGKSSMLDALTFALYGKPFRKIKLEQLVNSVNMRNCVAEIDFKTRGNQYTIQRSMKPASLTILENGKPLEKEGKKLDQQEFLETNILKLSLKSFTQLVILGSASFVPFMQLKAAERRALVEDILEIQVLSTMNELLKSRASKTKQDILLIEQQIVSTAEAIKLVSSSIRSMEQQADKERQIKLDRIREIEETVVQRNADIQAKNDEIAQIIEQIADEAEVMAKLSDYGDRKSKVIGRAKQLKEEIQFFKDNDNCPTCTQGIPDTFREQAVADKASYITRLQEGFNTLKEKERSFLLRKEKISECKNAIQDIRQSIAGLRAEISTLNAETRRLAAEIQKHDSSVIDVERAKLEELQSREEEYETTRKQLAETKRLQDVAAVMLKDGGIKTSIIRQYLPVINKVINRFLSALNFPVRFNLNETFDETILARHRDEFSYSSFSEGEKLRIDLSILFAWRDISRLKNSMATNLLILDEVVDSSLDGSGIDAFMSVLKELAKDTHVLVISHKSDALAERFDRTLRFVKRGNFSQVATA